MAWWWNRNVAPHPLLLPLPCDASPRQRTQLHRCIAPQHAATWLPTGLPVRTPFLSPRCPRCARTAPAGQGYRAPSSALPLGANSKADPLKLAPVSIATDLVHALLAVSYAQTPDQLLASNVAGFVLVTDVDVARGAVTVLAPCAGPLPGRYLIAGSQTAFLT